MIIWQGIRSNTSPADDAVGVSEWQQNTRMKKQGELQRRPGFLSTAIAQQSGPIYDIMSATGMGNNFLTFGTGAEMQGFPQGEAGDPWPPPPQPPQHRRPEVVPQNPSCAVGGTRYGTSSLSFADSAAAAMNDAVISVTAGCCYRIRHTINISATLVHTGAGGSPGPWDLWSFATADLTPLTCDSNQSEAIRDPSPPSPYNPFLLGTINDLNASLVIDGYVCASASVTLSSSEFTAFFALPNSVVVDPNYYDTTATYSVEVTNVYCPACNP